MTNPISRRDAVRILGTTLAGIPLAPAHGAARDVRRDSPNIIFIMTDDLRHAAEAGGLSHRLVARHLQNAPIPPSERTSSAVPGSSTRSFCPV